MLHRIYLHIYANLLALNRHFLVETKSGIFVGIRHLDQGHPYYSHSKHYFESNRSHTSLWYSLVA